MPQLDFKEIPQANLASGEQDTFEMFAREFLELLGYKVLSGPDRGADSGRDLIVLETRSGVGGETRVRWLVSCKHKAHSGQSVGLSDEQDITDRVKAHSCPGFIGVYSTLPASSLTKKLDGIKSDNASFEYQIFDKERIESALLSHPQGQAVAQRYFPNSFKITAPQTISIEDARIVVRDVVQDVFEKNFIRLQAAATEEAQRRTDLLEKRISEIVAAKLNTDELNNFGEPDVQYALFEAIKTGARNDSGNLRDMLATLVVERVRNNDNDLKKIIYSEAISTLGKLTRNQLDMLAICLLVDHEVDSLKEDVIDWSSYLKTLESRVSPFINCNVAYADLRHLQYSSCVYLSVGAASIIDSLKKLLPLLDQEGISESQVASIGLAPYEMDMMFTQLSTETDGSIKRYVFNNEYSHLSREEAYSQSMLEINYDDITAEQTIRIQRLLKKSLVPEREVEQRIPEAVKKLDAHWKAGLRTFSLTSVGLVLATCHIEQTSGLSFDISSWFT